jgi:hypothetical protein
MIPDASTRQSPGGGIVPLDVEMSEGGVARLEPVVGSGCRFHERKATP